MKLKHRRINYDLDKEYILERHCRVNYESDCPWKRKMPYDDYRREWFNLQGQVKGFSEALIESMKDSRTIAEIIENEDNIKSLICGCRFLLMMKADFALLMCKIFMWKLNFELPELQHC